LSLAEVRSDFSCSLAKDDDAVTATDAPNAAAEKSLKLLLAQAQVISPDATAEAQASFIRN
jgi:hypothetical protein